MSNDVKLEPEAIWLSPRCDAEAHHGEGRSWANHAPEPACDDCGLPWVKYVRADLASHQPQREAVFAVGVKPGDIPPSATVVDPLATLATPAPAVSRDETDLADEFERLLNKRADRSVPGGRVHDQLTHFVEKHRAAILSRLRGEGE